MPTKKPRRTKQPRHEVISLRLNHARLEVLERYRQAFADELGRDVSLSEAAFLALEDRAPGMDRAAARIAFLKTPTDSLARIRQRWESQHALSAVEWDVLATYVRIGADEERQRTPIAAVPSRESYVALLDAFEAVYAHRLEPASRQTWTYFGNLEGFLTADTLSVTDTEQRHQTVLAQIARRRALLQPPDRWERPGNVGHCFSVAVQEEGVDSTMLDQLLARHWPVLWRLAARGHWIRHDRRPVRLPESADDEARPPVSLPRAMSVEDLTVSFVSAGGAEFTTAIEWRPGHLRFDINRYPELVEFRAMLEADGDPPWIGRQYVMTVNNDRSGARTVSATRRQIQFILSATEWTTLRDLFRRAWESPELQRWLQELQLEYGEQG
ncbi:MAG: hypothetical protein ACRD1V_17230 [Vicinamibacterales bacterium]